MKILTSCLLMVFTLSACGVEEMIRRNDDRYMRPGALDSPLTGYYDVYQFKFLNKYRITHESPVSMNCEYRKVPTLNRTDRYKGEVYAVRDIYEENGKIWQHFEGMKPFDFDTYVRSVKIQQPIYGEPTYEEYEASMKAHGESIERQRKTGRRETYVDPGIIKPIGYKEIEAGLQPVCFGSWYVTSHSMVMRLHKTSLQDWKDLIDKSLIDKSLPPGKWSVQTVAGNNWAVRELQENELLTRPINGVGGPYQYWLLPIGDTGYTIALQLGASKETLQYPEANERFKATFRHLIESVKIEPLTPQLDAEMQDNLARAISAERQACLDKTRNNKKERDRCLQWYPMTTKQP